MSYTPPLILRNGHVQTILPTLLRRRIPALAYQRTTIELSDGDFLDIDSVGNSKKGVLMLHGLESSSTSAYIVYMAKALLSKGVSVSVLNFRGCSGRPNRLYRSYHSGVTEDFYAALSFCSGIYQSISAIGFSLGGNVLLKALGESGKHNIVLPLQKAVAISVPCDLHAGARQLALPSTKLYMKRFVQSFQKKMLHKQQFFAAYGMSTQKLQSVKTFYELDEVYTAPAHGFASAKEYWAINSSLPYLQNIQVPTLLINAKDDPFLPAECYPVINNPALCCEYPEHGGHFGFIQLFDKFGEYWHEQRAVNFLLENT
jgi:predicted alpha/beta-fold hydrolase